MSFGLESFNWIRDNQSFRNMPMKVSYFSLAQRKVPKETGLFARLGLKKLFQTVAQEYIHPTSPFRRSACGGTMPTPSLKSLMFGLHRLQKGQKDDSQFAADAVFCFFTGYV
jgi:hypothetical protein